MNGVISAETVRLCQLASSVNEVGVGDDPTDLAPDDFESSFGIGVRVCVQSARPERAGQSGAYFRVCEL